MHKHLTNKTATLLALLLSLTLSVLIGGSAAASAATQSSSQGRTLQQITPVKIGCAGKTPGCQGTVSSSSTKTGVRPGDTPSLEGSIIHLSETTIIVQAKTRVSMIHLTSATTFLEVNPLSKASQAASYSALKIGQVIQAEGTLQPDGSLVAVVVMIEQ